MRRIHNSIHAHKASLSHAHPIRALRSIRESGFTVIELLITCAVLITVTALAVPHFQQAIDQARIARAVGDIRTIANAITEYEAINQQFPNSLTDVGYGSNVDPWGHPYQYLNFATVHGNGQLRKDRFMVPLNSNFDLYSMGKDGRSVSPLTASASQDDIIWANDGSFIGLASDF